MIDATARMCQTAKFQHFVFELLDAFLPDTSEDMKDVRFILMHWNCTDQTIFWSQVKPSDETAAPEPGIPVGLLPFVLHEAIPPEVRDRQFPLHKAANHMLTEFYAVLAVLQSYGKDANPCDVPASVRAPFVDAAKTLAITYVKYTHPTSQEIKETLDRVLPLALELLWQRRPEHASLFMKIRSLYFGLHGVSVPADFMDQVHIEVCAQRIQTIFIDEARAGDY